MTKRIFRSISAKILIVIVLVLLPFNVLALSLSNAVMEAMVEQTDLLVKNVLENHATDLENCMETTRNYLYDICYGEVGMDFMEAEEAGENYYKKKIRFAQLANANMAMRDASFGYFTYVKNVEDVFIWYGWNSNRENWHEEKLQEEKIRSDIKLGWNLEKIGESQVALFCSRYSPNLEPTGSKYGVVINLEEIFDEVRSAIEYKDVVIFASEGMIDVEEKDQIAVSVPVDNCFYLHVFISESEVLEGIKGYYSFMKIGALVSLTLIPILYIAIRFFLISPLKILNNAQKKLREGNLEYRIREKVNSSEFEYTYASFNRMAEQISALKIENYERELDYQKMELNYLQLQIRPHFLLNTFNLIFNLSESPEEKPVREIITYLSDYFRYLVRSGRRLELFDKEQHLIEGYMKVVAERYPGKVEIAYEYDPEIHLVRVPPLMLHNFVENVIKHVVRQDTITHIALVGTYEDGMVFFQITDDGDGMSSDLVRELNESTHQKESNGAHVGYYNSMKRLKYFYGERAEITVSSEMGEGTSVTISFPYDLEGFGNEALDSE